MYHLCNELSGAQKKYATPRTINKEVEVATCTELYSRHRYIHTHKIKMFSHGCKLIPKVNQQSSCIMFYAHNPNLRMVGDSDCPLLTFMNWILYLHRCVCVYRTTANQSCESGNPLLKFSLCQELTR